MRRPSATLLRFMPDTSLSHGPIQSVCNAKKDPCVSTHIGTYLKKIGSRKIKLISPTRLLIDNTSDFFKPTDLSGTMRNIAAAPTILKAAKPKNTLRQSVIWTANSTGAVALIAPKPPAIKTNPLINGSFSFGNQRANALNDAIRQADTPNPINARARISSVTVSAKAKNKDPIEAMSRRQASVFRGPTRSKNTPRGS